MSLRKFEVLVVDDNPSDRLVLIAHLRKLGLRFIQEATDGSLAQEKIINQYQTGKKFDLVFLDWNMPKVTGLKVLKFIRSERKYEKLAVIFVMGTADQDRIEDIVSYKVDDVIVKPVDVKILEKKLTQIVNNLGLIKKKDP